MSVQMSNLEAKLDALIDALGFDVEEVYRYVSYKKKEEGINPSIEYKLTKREAKGTHHEIDEMAAFMLAKTRLSMKTILKDD